MNTMAGRFTLQVFHGSDDTWGWNGQVLDRTTGNKYPLAKTVLDYELHGERGYSICAFDTKRELMGAAKRKARALA